MSNHPSGSSNESSKMKWRLFALAAAASSFAILDISKINVALPAIDEALSAGSTVLQLLVAGYTLTFGLALIPAGRYGDITSRRRMFLIGQIVFAISSILCAIAPDPTTLLIGRLLQGVAAGIIMPQVIGLIQQTFQGRERGIAFGFFGAVIGLATAFGPTLGGFLLGIGNPEDSWRLIFWINIPFAVLIFAAALVMFPRTQLKAEGKTNMDTIGVLLIGLIVVALMIPFVFTTGGPDDDPNRWYWLVAFAAAAIVFYFWETRYAARGKTPVLDFRLLKFASYRNSLIIIGSFFGIMPPTILIVTLYLQNGLHYQPLFAGLVMAPMALASAGASWFSGQYTHRFGRGLVITGLTLVTVGLLLTIGAVLLAPAETAGYILAGMLMILGAGTGLVISPNQTLMLSEVPVTQGGLAGSVGQVAQRAGTAIGLAGATAIYYSTIYQEIGTRPELDVYHDAAAGALSVLFIFIGISMLFALIDLFQSRGRSKS